MYSKRAGVRLLNTPSCMPCVLLVSTLTRIILRPLSALSLDIAKRNITTGLFGYVECKIIQTSLGNYIFQTITSIFCHNTHRRSWHGLTTPLFSNFLLTNLFSIKFLYFFIISSYFNVEVNAVIRHFRLPWVLIRNIWQ
jgi:hypothetical protein